MRLPNLSWRLLGAAALLAFGVGWSCGHRGPGKAADLAIARSGQLADSVRILRQRYRMDSLYWAGVEAQLTDMTGEAARLRGVAEKAQQTAQNALARAKGHREASDTALARGDTATALREAQQEAAAATWAAAACQIGVDSLSASADSLAAGLARCRTLGAAKDSTITGVLGLVDRLRANGDSLARFLSRSRHNPRWSAGALWTSDSRGPPQGGYVTRDLGPFRLLVGALDVGGLVGIGGVGIRF
jgi:TolA-binding protein